MITGGKPTTAVLRVGDRVRSDGAVQTVVGLSGTMVRLADEHGQTSVVRLPHLLTDPSFERIGGRDPGPLLPAGLLNGLPKVDDEPLWSLLGLQDLLDAWIVANWQTANMTGSGTRCPPGGRSPPTRSTRP